MPRQYRVMWICDILADDEVEAAESARRTIATSPYSYFDVFKQDDSDGVQIEVPNTGKYLDGGISYPQYANHQKVNN